MRTALWSSIVACSGASCRVCTLVRCYSDVPRNTDLFKSSTAMGLLQPASLCALSWDVSWVPALQGSRESAEGSSATPRGTPEDELCQGLTRRCFASATAVRSWFDCFAAAATNGLGFSSSMRRPRLLSGVATEMDGLLA